MGFLKTHEVDQSYPHSSKFFGRVDELKLLQQWLPKNKKILISGPCGIGKSELIRQFVQIQQQQHQEKCQNFCCLWLDGTSDVSLMSDIQINAENLGVIHQRNAQLPPRLYLRSILCHSEIPGTSAKKSKWIVCIDNINQFSPRLVELLKEAGELQIPVYMTSSQPMDEIADYIIDLDALEDKDAVNFVKSAIDPPPSDFDAGSLCKELYNIPLALELATAFINESQKPYNVMNYLQELKHEGVVFLGPKTGAQHQLKRLYSVVIKSIRKFTCLPNTQTPKETQCNEQINYLQSAKLVKIISLLNPVGFTEEFLFRVYMSSINASYTECFFDREMDIKAELFLLFHQWLKPFKTHRLLNAGKNMVTVHPFVQKIMQEMTLNGTTIGSVAKLDITLKTVMCLVRFATSAPVQPVKHEVMHLLEIWRNVLAHWSTEDLKKLIESCATDVLNFMKNMQDTGHFNEALSLAMAVRNVLTDANSDMAFELDARIACIYLAQRHKEKGMECLQSLLYRLRQCGNQKRREYQVVLQIAGTKRRLGQHRKAKELLEKCVREASENLGKDYLLILEMKRELAIIYFEFDGDYKRAETLFHEIFAQKGDSTEFSQKRTTLTCDGIYWIGRCLSEQGKFKDAIAHFQKGSDGFLCFCNESISCITRCKHFYAISLGNVGNLDTAHQYFTQVFRMIKGRSSLPRDVDLLAEKDFCHVLRLEGKAEEAKTRLQKLVGKSKYFNLQAEILWELGHCLKSMKEKEKAQEAFTSCLEIIVGHPERWSTSHPWIRKIRDEIQSI